MTFEPLNPPASPADDTTATTPRPETESAPDELVWPDLGAMFGLAAVAAAVAILALIRRR